MTGILAAAAAGVIASGALAVATGRWIRYQAHARPCEFPTCDEPGRVLLLLPEDLEVLTCRNHARSVTTWVLDERGHR